MGLQLSTMINFLKDVTRQNYHLLVKTLLDMESVKNLVLQIIVMIMNILNQIIQLKAFGQNAKYAQESFQIGAWQSQPIKCLVGLSQSRVEISLKTLPSYNG